MTNEFNEPFGSAAPIPAPVFPRELRVWAINHYARFGSMQDKVASAVSFCAAGGVA